MISLSESLQSSFNVLGVEDSGHMGLSFLFVCQFFWELSFPLILTLTFKLHQQNLGS